MPKKAKPKSKETLEDAKSPMEPEEGAKKQAPKPAARKKSPVKRKKITKSKMGIRG